MSPSTRLRLKDDVADWDALAVGTSVHRYFDGNLMYGGKEVEIVSANSDVVEFALPEDVGVPGHNPVRVTRMDRKDPRRGNQFTRA